MHAFTIIAASVAAVAPLALAVPHGHSHRHSHAAVEERDSSTFQLTVHNNCSETKTFGLFQITPAFAMNEMSTPVAIEPGCSSVINAPFTALGMRLSATADQGCAAQWEAQTLFEFGYSAWNGLTGTAYDLSVMNGTANEQSIGAYPDTSACENKVCTSLGCCLADAWTAAVQALDGSPADTVCYQGKQNFDIVWCPSS